MEEGLEALGQGAKIDHPDDPTKPHYEKLTQKTSLRNADILQALEGCSVVSPTTSEVP